MAHKKTVEGPTWGYNKAPASTRARTVDEFAALREATKLRTLVDMTEREIRALERCYGCRVIRPEKAPRRARRVSQGAATAARV
jgi:hypothetical protein